ncbi:MAG: hypothetical protein ACK5LO_01140 [Leucobacter sp.]
MPITDAEVLSRLKNARLQTPAVRDATATALVAAAGESSRSRRRRSLRLTITASLAAVAIAVPTAAYAIKLFEAQTGRVVEAGQTENTAGDEYVDLGATDLAEYWEGFGVAEAGASLGLNAVAARQR